MRHYVRRTCLKSSTPYSEPDIVQEEGKIEEPTFDLLFDKQLAFYSSVLTFLVLASAAALWATL